MAFSMQDVLLEPYGGQILNLTVSATTTLTATLATGGLFGFGWASRVLGRGADPFKMASLGALVGIPAFLAVISAASIQSTLLFGFGVLFIGFGGGLFSHGTLTATMNFAPEKQRGLALGAWGAAQATAAGVAVAVGGVFRDIVAAISAQNMLPPAISGPATGYIFVYLIEVVLLAITMAAMIPLMRRSGQPVPA
jgi:BCD family chlorophyll transporter-like MFS transporter